MTELLNNEHFMCDLLMAGTCSTYPRMNVNLRSSYALLLWLVSELGTAGEVIQKA